MALNKVLLIGNVGKDPEIRVMNNGNEIALFSLATTDVWKDKNTGERRDKTEWHRIVIYAPGLVNITKSFIKKGSKVYVEGTLQTRRWTDPQGVDRQVTEIVLQGFNCSLQMLDSRNNNNNNNNSNFDENYYSNLENNSSNKTNEEETQFIDEVIDDDIPF